MLGHSTKVLDYAERISSQRSSAPKKTDLSPSRLPLPVGDPLKRSIDLVLASIALVLLLPVFGLLALLIKIGSPGPVFYGHTRVGFGGRMFQCLKFRTMVTNSDEVLSELLANSSAARDEWRQTQKLRNDPRVTRIGRLLRKSSLDELPQLLNIVSGEMSCVGPRPVILKELDRYGAHSQDYLAARPGLTGLWQVSGRSSVGYDQRVVLDRYYVRRWSVLLDLKIILKTIPAVLNSRHAS